VTWTFLFLAALILGVVTGCVTGLFRDAFYFGRSHRHLVVPKAEQHFPVLSPAVERASALLTAFGLAGLAMNLSRRFDPVTTVVAAGAVAAVAGLAAVMLLRRRCGPSRVGARVSVVGDIAPGGYGQVVFGSSGEGVRLAARNAEDETIPAGCEVVVVDCEHSVVAVRRAQPA
jgi:hypothetical protein